MKLLPKMALKLSYFGFTQTWIMKIQQHCVLLTFVRYHLHGHELLSASY